MLWAGMLRLMTIGVALIAVGVGVALPDLVDGRNERHISVIEVRERPQATARESAERLRDRPQDAQRARPMREKAPDGRSISSPAQEPAPAPPPPAVPAAPAAPFDEDGEEDDIGEDD